MGRKMPRKSYKKHSSARKTVAEITIQEGHSFVNSYASRRISSRLVGTRTMKDIVRGNVSSVRIRGRKVDHDFVTDKTKQIKKQSTKTTKVSTTAADRTKSAGKKDSKADRRAPRASSVPAVIVSPVIVPPVAPAPVVRTSSRASNVGGKVAQLSKSKSKNVQIPAFGFIDVCFCVDSTGSMSSQLSQVQEVIKSIIDNIQNKVRTEGLQLRFAIVSYRDHPPQDSSYVTKHLDFTDQFEAIQYVKQLQAMGGGDEPQAAHDGLLISAKNLRWAQVDGTPVLRYIFHIADAPPHGKQFKNPQSQQGCLCGLKTDDIIREINKKSIHYRLIKARANPKLDEMEKIFKSKVGDFDSTDIGHARELNVKVSDMIIHEVLPDYA